MTLVGPLTQVYIPKGIKTRLQNDENRLQNARRKSNPQRVTETDPPLKSQKNGLKNN